jgi:hypothetical protein
MGDFGFLKQQGCMSTLLKSHFWALPIKGVKNV